ncbi:CAP domain-containing protein [Parvularcula sp. LCG005]|uniref:CAP domain-containing protein n=1 Tax=Parvularcula sp. LCG005 TaxID=3078805 RepID=UPI0029425D39|nr:CAP domain-containing protein [Parvularcula sp. LCG005]WOI52552.1 CAP domain-containing protein [Parvularcula sp. LCG005]
MTRTLLLAALSVGMMGCASQLPLPEDDGRYQAPPSDIIAASGEDETVLPAELLAASNPTVDPSPRARAPMSPPLRQRQPKPGTIFGEAAPVAEDNPVDLKDETQLIVAPTTFTPAVPVTATNADMTAVPPQTAPLDFTADASPVPLETLGVEERTAIEAFIAQVNEERDALGFPPLTYSAALSGIATGHVAYLAHIQDVTSEDANGRGIGQRLLRHDYLPNVAGSLVAGGYADYMDAFDSWRSNKVEFSRLLLRHASDIGVARVTDPTSRYYAYIEVIVAGH